jgi:hypothetical protein
MVKIGDKVIAKKTIRMSWTKEIALLKGKAYIIKDIDCGDIIFDSEIGEDHYWPIEDIPNDFFIGEQIRKINNIKLL